MQEVCEKKISDHKARILQFLVFKDIRKSTFYKETGLSNGFLDNSSGVTLRALEAIISAYPDLNATWLLTGLGRMTNEKIHSNDSLNIHGDVANGNNNNVTIGHNALQVSKDNLLEDRAIIPLLERQLKDKDEYIRYLSERLAEAQKTIHTLSLKVK